jgi:predicted PurR-regulated permease PerM
VTCRFIYSSIFLAAGLYVVILNFALISPILLSICLILLITLALNPLVIKLRRVLVRRDVATIIMAVAFLLVVSLAAWAFYSPLRNIAANFIHKIPEYRQKLEEPLHRLDGTAHTPNQPAQPSAPPAPGQPGQPANPPPQPTHIDMNAVLSHLGKLAGSLASNTAAMAAVVLTVFVGVVYTLMNPRPVFRTFFGFVPDAHQETALRIGRRVAAFVPRWALALLMGMGIIGTLVFLAVWPILGFQNAVLMGVIAFVFEAIPYIGAIIAGVPALLLAMEQGGSAPLWIVVAYVCIQLMDHNVINPLIVAGSVRQHPLAVIVAVLFCLPAFGILGVLLAVPLVATLEILYEEIYLPRFLPKTSQRELEERARDMLSGAPSRTPDASGGETKEPRSKRLRRHEGWTGHEAAR